MPELTFQVVHDGGFLVPQRFTEDLILSLWLQGQCSLGEAAFWWEFYWRMARRMEPPIRFERDEVVHYLKARHRP